MAKSLFTSFDSISLREIESEADLIPLMTAEDEEGEKRIESECMEESFSGFRMRGEEGPQHGAMGLT